MASSVTLEIFEIIEGKLPRQLAERDNALVYGNAGDYLCMPEMRLQIVYVELHPLSEPQRVQLFCNVVGRLQDDESIIQTIQEKNRKKSK